MTDQHLLSNRLGPLLSQELLDTLDALYPSRPPSLTDSEREIWAKAGERRLVDVLWSKFAEANDNQQET